MNKDCKTEFLISLSGLKCGRLYGSKMLSGPEIWIHSSDADTEINFTKLSYFWREVFCIFHRFVKHHKYFEAGLLNMEQVQDLFMLLFDFFPPHVIKSGRAPAVCLCRI